MASNCADFNDTVALDTLLRHFSPVINNIPYELGVELLRQGFIEFCRRTEFLTSQQELQPQKDVSDYELVPPEGYDVFKVKGVGRGPEFMVMPNVNYWYAGWGTNFYIIGTQYIVLRNSPSSDLDEPFAITMIVLPNECCVRIPREIAVAYGLTIAKHAIAAALLYKNKPWFDPNLSAKFERQFYNGVQSARNLVLMNRGAASTSARTRRWV